VVEAPLANALDMLWAFEVIVVFGFLQPSSLSVGFAGFAAVGLATVALTLHVTMVGMEERFAVRTLALTN
jgi:hypothetical protein